MAEEKDITQDIILNYKSNAKEVAGDVDNLNSSYEAVNTEKKQGNEITKQEEQAYKSMKTQIREATNDLLKMSQTYGDTSKEAVNAAKKVAELKDQMGFANDLVEGFNPDRKFQGMATAVNAAATAASGITSGMALFGAESEQTEKALLKVQAAMAFSDSIGKITEMGDDFAKLKAQVVSAFTALSTAKVTDTATTEINTASKAKNIAVSEGGAVATGLLTGATSLQTIATTGATIATNLFNASLAVLLSPITLVVAGIAGLVAGIGYLAGAFGDYDGSAAKAEKANKKLNSEMETLTKTSEKTNAQMELSHDHALAMAKANGASSQEIRKLKEELINQEVAEKRLNAVKAQSIFIEARRVAGLEGATDAQKEASKKAYELFKEQNEIYATSIKDRQKLNLNNKVEERQEQTDRNKEALEKQKEHNEKLKEERQKRAEEAKKEREKKAEEERKAEEKRLKDLADLELRYINDLANLKADTEQQKLDLQKSNEQKELDNLKGSAEEKIKLQTLLNEKFSELQSDLDKKTAQEKATKLKELLDSKALTEKEFADAETIAEVEAMKLKNEAKLEAQKEIDLTNAEALGATLEEQNAIKAYYVEQENENTRLAEEQKKELNDQIAADKIATEQNVSDAVKSIKENGIAVIDSLEALGLKKSKTNEAIKKGLALTEIGIDTAKAISTAIPTALKAGQEAAKVAGPAAAVVGPLVTGASLAGSLAMVAKNVASAKKLLGKGGGGDVPSGGAPPSPSGAAPQVGFQNSSENQIATSINTQQSSQPPIQAFVVSSAVTTAQAADRNRVDGNSF